MSDLISRSELLNAMNTWDKFGCDCHSGLVRIDNTNNEEYVPFVHYEDMVNCVKNIPTAYDVDKVVEDLEEAKHEICLSDEDLEHYQNGIDNAIEIVKQGGVGTETETIRDKAIKWNNNSSKRVPYEFIDYVEGKREIGVSDDVCEWKSDYGFVSDKYKRETRCGYTFYDLHHAVPFNYCPYCGKKIKAGEDNANKI